MAERRGFGERIHHGSTKSWTLDPGPSASDVVEQTEQVLHQLQEVRVFSTEALVRQDLFHRKVERGRESAKTVDY